MGVQRAAGPPPEFVFTAELWRYPGNAAWHFVTLPPDVSDELDEVAGPKGGFGSVRVVVAVGATQWRTSVFPDKSRGAFILPMKKEVRAREDLAEGDSVQVVLSPATDAG